MRQFRRTVAQGLESLALALAVLAAVCMLGIVALITTSVVMRRVAGAPLRITEDAVGLMLSAVLFLGLPLVTLRSQHVRVAIVANALGPRFERALHVAAMLVGLVFFGWLFVKALPWLEFAWRRNLRTETARLILYPWMATLPLSVGLTWLIYAARLGGVLEPERPSDPETLPASGKDD